MPIHKQAGASVQLPSDREIVITRTFDAPRTVVFQMWTRPEHVTQWWDPGGQPLVECEIDLRPGGQFRFVSRGAGEMVHPFVGTYQEIDPPARLVFTTPSPTGATTTGTLAFAEAGDRTLLTLTMTFASAEDRDAMLAMGVDVGTVKTLDNLAAYVSTDGSRR